MSAPALPSTTTAGGAARPGADGTTPAWPRWVAAGATLLALVLVVVDAGSKSIWYDEGFTLFLVDGSLAHLWDGISGGDVNQSPFYVLFWAWYHVAGHSEASLRLLPGLCAAATVPVVYLLGRRLHGPAVGALAAVLVAVHAEVIGWGQQLRGYSTVLLLVTLATWLFVRAVERPTTGRSVAYALMAALAVYGHFLAGFVLLAHALSLLVVRPFPRRLVVVAGAVGGVLLLPLVIFVLSVDGDPLEWIPPGSLKTLYERLGDLAGGASLQLAVVGLAVLAGGIAAANVLRRRPWSQEAFAHVLPLLWLAAPVVAVVGSTWAGRPLLVARYLVLVVPALALVAASGVAALARVGGARVAAVAVTALVAVSLVGTVDWYRAPDVEDWRTVAATLVPELGPDDALVFTPTRNVHSFAYYRDALDLPPVTVLRPRTGDPAVAERVFELTRGRRLEVARRRTPELGPWLDAHYRLVDTREFPGVTVRVYARA